MIGRRKQIIKCLFILCVSVVASCADISGLNAQSELSADKDVVILLHGLGRNKTAMWRLAGRLEDAGYHVERIGYDSLTQTPEEIVAEVTGKIEQCCRVINNRLHFVGHSLGGLVTRAYLQNNRLQNLGRVVLIGTPNQGSSFVDRYQDRWWLKMMGPMTRALGSGPESFAASLDEPYYPVGVIAGIRQSRNDSYLPGEDDGLVTVAATKLNGMTDFTLVKTSHSAMRYDETVAQLAIDFLRDGQFPEE